MIFMFGQYNRIYLISESVHIFINLVIDLGAIRTTTRKGTVIYVYYIHAAKASTLK